MKKKQRSTHSAASWRTGMVFLVSLIVLASMTSSIPALASRFFIETVQSSSSSLPSEVGELPAMSVEPQTLSPSTNWGRYLFGVISDQGERYDDLWERGVRATTLEFKWRLYEPREGEYDQNYVRHMQATMASLKSKGFFVQMIPGIQYGPDWVFENHPDMYYVNQYGERFDPDPVAHGDFRVINAPFNPQARELIAGYLERIFTDFDQSDPFMRFDTVRVGGGVQGELRYPPAEWGGTTTAYWSFDPVAQNPSLSGIPEEVVGWRPLIDPNPGSQGAGQLLINPRYEESHPNFPVLGWSPDALAKAAITSESPHSGTYALQLDLDGPHRIHQYVTVEPEGAYRIRGWLRSSQGEGLARLFVTQEDRDHRTVTGQGFIKLEGDGADWNEVEAAFQLAPETRFLKIELDGSQPGTYFFDDLQLLVEGRDPDVQRNIDVPLAFYDWYLEKLSAYQNWQIEQIRRHFDGQLDLVYAGKGSSMNAITDALVADLTGESWSENGRALYAGTFYPRHLASLESPGKVAVYLTGIEQPAKSDVDDLSPDPGDWSAARWLAYLAGEYEMPIWGENSGANNTQELYLSAERMQANGFFGLMWGFESELYAGDYASIDDLQEVIRQYSTHVLYIPVCSSSS